MGTLKNRNSGIELLRILAILMVISLHRAGNNTLQAAPMYSVSYYVLWFVQIASYKAVDIFFLICAEFYNFRGWVFFHFLFQFFQFFFQFFI